MARLSSRARASADEAAREEQVALEEINRQLNIQYYNDGVSCDQCPYVCRTEKGMTEHCRDKHARGAHHTVGRGQKGRDGPMWKTNITCQRLLMRGIGSQHFVVTVATREKSTSPLRDLDPSSAESHTNCIQAMVDEQQEDFQDRSSQTIQPGHVTEVSPWLHINQWPLNVFGRSGRRKCLSFYHLTTSALLPSSLITEHLVIFSPAKSTCDIRNLRRLLFLPRPASTQV